MEVVFSNSPTPEIAEWARDGDETVLAKKFGLALVSQHFRHPITGKSEEYAYCRKTPGVTVVPVLTDGTLVITRTFKQGNGLVVWEFPAGRMSKESTADAQARAELAEESGVTPMDMVSLGIVCVAPRKFATKEALFVALDCVLGTPNPEPGEILQVCVVTTDEFWELALEGKVSGFSELAAHRAAATGYIQGPRHTI